MRSRVSPDIGGDGHFFPIVLLRWRLLTRVKIRWRQKQLVEPFFSDFRECFNTYLLDSFVV